jgi:hypothetical protein
MGEDRSREIEGITNEKRTIKLENIDIRARLLKRKEIQRN